MKRPADLKESFDFCGLEDENYVSVSHCFTIKIKVFGQEKGCSSQTKTWQVNNVLMKEFD